MTIIDTHQHFWDPSEMDLPKSPPEASILDNAYLPSDLEPEISKVGVNYTVLVQGYPQDLDTNRWYFKHANANSFIAGVVAWVDLENPSTLDAQLDDLYLEPKFVGIRHNVEGELNPDWILLMSRMLLMHSCLQWKGLRLLMKLLTLQGERAVHSKKWQSW